MDGVVLAQSKSSSNKLYASCYTEKMFSLSSSKNSENNCSSNDRSYRRRSFNTSLHSIDETDTLDFQRSRKRELSTANVYPEKRLSDPLVHCAFINKGFDVELNRRHFSMYDSFSYVQHHREAADHSKMNIYTIPKIKVRISDECGNRIENSLDSDSEIDDCWNFGTTMDQSHNHCQSKDAFNIICNEAIGQPTVNKCRKCGHRKSLKAQFSTTFS